MQATISGAKPTAGKCPHCGNSLPQMNIALPGHRPRLISMPCTCPDAVAEFERQEREAFNRARAEVFNRIWSRANIPEEFKHVEADFSMADVLDSHHALYLTGETGRGKTHKACQYAKGYLIRHIRKEHGSMWCDTSIQFLEAETVQSLLRSTWNRWDQSEDDLFQRWVGVGLLVFDDIGKGNPSETAAENVFRIIRRRQEGHKETIFTSQYSTGELVDRFSQASDRTTSTMKSRLRGWCTGIVLDGPDRRIERIR